LLKKVVRVESVTDERNEEIAPPQCPGVSPDATERLRPARQIHSRERL
jgi:hypothetical protein